MSDFPSSPTPQRDDMSSSDIMFAGTASPNDSKFTVGELFHGGGNGEKRDGFNSEFPDTFVPPDDMSPEELYQSLGVIAPSGMTREDQRIGKNGQNLHDSMLASGYEPASGNLHVLEDEQVGVSMPMAMPSTPHRHQQQGMLSATSGSSSLHYAARPELPTPAVVPSNSTPPHEQQSSFHLSGFAGMGMDVENGMTPNHQGNRMQAVPLPFGEQPSFRMSGETSNSPVSRIATPVGPQHAHTSSRHLSNLPVMRGNGVPHHGFANVSRRTRVIVADINILGSLLMVFQSKAQEHEQNRIQFVWLQSFVNNIPNFIKGGRMTFLLRPSGVNFIGVTQPELTNFVDCMHQAHIWTNGTLPPVLVQLDWHPFVGCPADTTSEARRDLMNLGASGFTEYPANAHESIVAAGPPVTISSPPPTSARKSESAKRRRVSKPSTRGRGKKEQNLDTEKQSIPAEYLSVKFIARFETSDGTVDVNLPDDHSERDKEVKTIAAYTLWKAKNGNKLSYFDFKCVADMLLCKN